MSCDPIAAINEAMENAVAAQEAGDYAAALRYMETAYMRITVLPNTQFDDERLEWRPDGIQALIKYLQTKVNAQSTSGTPRGTLIRPNEVTYKRG
jgi:hypothetical protein